MKLFNSKKVYEVQSSFPNLYIAEYELVAEDKYCYCVRNPLTKLIHLVNKEDASKTLKDAFQILYKKGQKDLDRIITEIKKDKNK